MKFVVLLTAGAFAATDAGAEIARAESCRKGSDLRVIEIVAPGAVGAACDVRYVRDGGANVTVPYNANSDSNFCRARAAELAATLIADGFECSTAASQAVEASLAGGKAEPAAAAPESLNAQLAEHQDNARGGAAALETLAQPEQIAAAPAPASPEPAPLPSAEAAPVHLAADVRPSSFRAPRPSRTTGAGRLVGAQPSIEDIIDVAASSSPPPLPTHAVPSEKLAAATAAGIPARDPAAIIRSVLAANAAAWNEGNLDAFMSGYADANDVSLVKDGAVAKGWSQVRKAYGEDIAAGGEMGRLSFDTLDIQLTAADVATATGRYGLERSAGASSGVVTLVMKRIDGRWRIVQETRVADAPPTE